MSTADELKALGNKAIAEKNFDEAVYVTTPTFLPTSYDSALLTDNQTASTSLQPLNSHPRTTFFTATDQPHTHPRRTTKQRSRMQRRRLS